MYAIPRANDCVFGGTNDLSDKLAADPATTQRIVGECSRVLNIDKPPVVAERVGLRPFRRSGVRLERVVYAMAAPSFITTVTAAPVSPSPGAARVKSSRSQLRLGSARVPRVGLGVAPKQSFSKAVPIRDRGGFK